MTYFCGYEFATKTPAAQYGIQSYLTTILIDRHGQIVDDFDVYDRPKAIAEMKNY